MKRVIKLGGSLLDWEEWPAACRRWMVRQPAATNLFIVGGGTVVNAIRQLSVQLQVSDETSHWAAIRAMSATALLATAALADADAKLVDDVTAVVAELPSSCHILDVERCLRAASRHSSATQLPPSWDVTSDSIAAWVAGVWGAEELVLLKSSSPPAHTCDLFEAADRGFVDAHFPRAAAGLQAVGWINLRKPDECGQLKAVSRK